MKIWRDLPNAKFLVKYLGVEQTDPIVVLVNNYHKVPKARLANFGIRIQKLQEIARKAKRAVRLDNVQNVPHRMLTQNLAKDYYYAAVAHRAEAKADYLNILQRFYRSEAGAKEVNDPDCLLREIRTAQNKHRAPGKMLELYAGCHLERHDPIHRQWEMWFETLPTGQEKFTGPQGFPHMTATREWYQELMSGDCNEPLFVYLENSPHCRDFGMAGYMKSVEKSVQMGHFSYKGALEYWIPSKQAGQVRFLDVKMGLQAGVFFLRPDYNAQELSQGSVDQNGQMHWMPFDTSWITEAQSEKGATTAFPSMAYNWLKSKELYAALHNPKQGPGAKMSFHHSSFISGGPVRCAGMIGGANGKITYIDNNSGHYKPPYKNLRKLVKYLFNKGFFYDTATVMVLGPKFKGLPVNTTGITVRQFLKDPRFAQIDYGLQLHA